jgi:Protein of unknown function (DUF2752)
MRVVWRRIPREEFNHELVWLVVSLTAFAGAAVWLGFGFHWPRCFFLAATGHPCLTCGATRCAIALSHGDFSGAWTWNPLAFLGLIALVPFDLYAGLVLLTRGPRLRVIDWTRPEKNAARVAVIALLAVNWIYLLTHSNRY